MKKINAFRLSESFASFVKKENSPLNEGQFSWMTQDTDDQIGSERLNNIHVYMFDNEGNR